MVHVSKLITLLCLVALVALIWLFIADRTVAEKLMTGLAMPAGLMWLGSTLAIIVAGFKRQTVLFVLAALIWLALFVSGNSYLAIRFAETLERPYLNLNPLEQPRLDAIVVLGGSTSVGANGVTRLGWHGDRVMLAVRLYRRGLASRVICTGSRIPALDRNGMDPKDMAAELCIEAGIPADRIERVDGINTSQEMQQLSAHLQPGDRVGLITSACHMPRALRLARAQGLELIPLPADFVTPAILFPTLLDFVPDADAMMVTRLVCKEYLARLVGR
jgi:uncharacterized SAM-binding protein YcdF (DUF218 family)